MTKDKMVGERLSVQELIDILQKFPKDMGVVDCGFNGIIGASIRTWVHSNYPWDMPDTDYVMIE